MPKLATATSLSDYPKITIAEFKAYLKQIDEPCLHLSYYYQGKNHSHTVNTDKTPCHFGGHRYWFICPKCQKRVGVLYGAGLFVCRHCIQANYATQLMQPIGRVFKRMNTIRQRLGWPAGVIHGVGARPKHMQQKTFDRLVDEYMELECTLCIYLT